MRGTPKKSEKWEIPANSKKKGKRKGGTGLGAKKGGRKRELGDKRGPATQVSKQKTKKAKDCRKNRRCKKERTVSGEKGKFGRMEARGRRRRLVGCSFNKKHCQVQEKGAQGAKTCRWVSQRWLETKGQKTLKGKNNTGSEGIYRV